MTKANNSVREDTTLKLHILLSSSLIVFAADLAGSCNIQRSLVILCTLYS